MRRTVGGGGSRLFQIWMAKVGSATEIKHDLRSANRLNRSGVQGSLGPCSRVWGRDRPHKRLVLICKKAIKARNFVFLYWTVANVRWSEASKGCHSGYCIGSIQIHHPNHLKTGCE